MINHYEACFPEITPPWRVNLNSTATATSLSDGDWGCSSWPCAPFVLRSRSRSMPCGGSGYHCGRWHHWVVLGVDITWNELQMEYEAVGLSFWILEYDGYVDLIKRRNQLEEMRMGMGWLSKRGKRTGWVVWFSILLPYMRTFTKQLYKCRGSINQSIYLSINLSIYQSINQSIYLSNVGHRWMRLNIELVVPQALPGGGFCT